MRLHINLDDELAGEIDALAGPRGRSRYIREAIASRVETDRRTAARRRLVGMAPGFASGVTAETIAADRAREDRERVDRLAGHWRGED